MNRHPLAGSTVTLNSNAKDLVGEVVPGRRFIVEDYWSNLTGESWKESRNSNLAAIGYAMRIAASSPHLLDSDEAVYGHIGCYGYLVHESELGPVV